MEKPATANEAAHLRALADELEAYGEWSAEACERLKATLQHHRDRLSRVPRSMSGRLASASARAYLDARWAEQQAAWMRELAAAIERDDLPAQLRCLVACARALAEVAEREREH